ncbi:inositol monophosphatase [Dactylosporangium sp. NBC_01737]|uniref:inositol monophosphatase family protein n=1 Tax=Dactylosporangium sp. NBC_01737 TaxID=2975959 RepID=UPI002E135204|nr:inositol monophosphatase [Dactylosporangium sp. NBC_01737]
MTPYIDNSAPERELRESLRQLAVAVAREGADLAIRLQREGIEVADTKKAPEDIVTAADRAVESLIWTRLAEARPGDGFCGEESPQVGSDTGYFWIVDPIDGTVNYYYGQQPSSVSVAVARGSADPDTWQLLAGCVVNISNGETFSAAKGAGAFLGSAPIRVRHTRPSSLALVSAGFGYFPEQRMQQAEVLKRLLGRVRDMRRVGSAALELCSVASGRHDMYYERGLNAWDIAAGMLIAAEAGADVVGLDGRPAGPEFIMVAHPELAAEFAPLVIEWHRDVGLIPSGDTC